MTRYRMEHRKGKSVIKMIHDSHRRDTYKALLVLSVAAAFALWRHYGN